MTKRVLLAVSLALGITPTLFAQDGLRSASLPERPIATQPPGPEDLFRATPDTYRPHPDRPFAPQPVIGGVYWPYPDVMPPVITRERVVPTADPRTIRIEIVTPPPAEPVAAPAPPVAAPPAVKKTLYVIPRCYAGDKPPDAGTHCDLTKLHTIR